MNVLQMYMNYTIRTHCIFCNNTLVDTYFKNDYENYVAHYQIEKESSIESNQTIPFNICVCNVCETPQLKYLGGLNEIYKTNHADSTGQLMIILHKKVCDLVYKYKENIHNIIEIGSSKGVLADFILEKIELEYNIIEPSYWGNRENKIIYDSFYEDVDDRNIDANTIIISHVFEHFYKPMEIIEKIHNNVNIKNFILVFPDLEYYINNNNLHVLNTEHTFYCDNNFLINILKLYGFTLIERIDYENHSVIFYFERKEYCKNIDIIPYKNKNYSLDVYYNTIQNTITKFNSIIDTNETKEVYIWPASIHSLYLIPFGLKINKLRGFLDNSPNKIGKKLYGTELEIFSFSEMIQKNDNNTIILINGGVFNKDIQQSTHANCYSA